MFNLSNLIESPRIRRVCLLNQNSALRRYKSVVDFHQKHQLRQSKAFTQNVLLYLAESSQLRHQRHARTNKITKMYRVCLDDIEPLQLTKLSWLKGIQSEEAKDSKKKVGGEGDVRSAPRSLSNASEMSFASSIEDANRRVSLLHRSRARSIGVIQEVPEVRLRRLSAPEVVITPVTPAPAESSDSLEEPSSPPATPPLAADENDILTQKGRRPSISRLPLGNQHERTPSPSRSTTKSSFRSYSKASGPLLKRMISHDSSASKRRSQRTDAVPQVEVELPALDQRFLELISNLHIYLKHSQDAEALQAMSLKKSAN